MKAEKRSKKQLVDEIKRLRSENDRLRKGSDEETEVKFKLIAENISDVILTLDLDGNFTYVGPSISNIGLSPEDLYGTNLADALAPESAALAFKALDEELKNEKKKGIDPDRFRTLELELLDKKKNIVWVEARMSFLRDGGGKAAGLLGVARNIEERKQVEKALKNSEERYRSLIENSAYGFYTMDLKGRITYANEPARKIVEMTEDELIGFDFKKFLHKEDLKAAKERIARAATGKKRVAPKIYRVITKNGGIKHVEVNTIALLEDGKPKGFHGTLVDVTESVKAQRALIESEERYRLMVQNSPDMIMLADKKGEVVFASPQSLKVIGHPPESILGQDFPDFIHPEDLEEAYQAFARTMSGRPVLDFEYRVFGEKGEVHWISHSARPFFQDDVQVGIQSNVRDITEQKRAQLALAESESKYAALVEESQDVIAIFQDNELKFLNKAVRKLLGYTPNQLIGKGFMDLLAPESLQLVAQRYKDRMAGKKVPKIYEVTALRKDRSRVPVEINATLIKYNGKPADLVVIRNLTERKRMEEELRDHREHLEQLVKDRTKELTRTLRKLQNQIEQRKKAEEEAKKSQSQLKAIIESIPFGIFAIDDTGKYFLQNSQNRKNGGNIIGKRPADIDVDKATKKIWLDNNKRAFSGETINEDVSYLVKDKTMHVTNIISPIKFKKNIIGIVGVNIDITERKATQLALLESEEKYRNLFENSLVGMFRISLEDGTLLEANKTFLDMLGMKKVLPLKPNDIFATLEHMDGMHYGIRELGNLDNFQTEIRRLDDTLFWGSVNAKMYPGQGFIECVVTDITEKRRMEEEIQKMNKLESLGILAGGIAHDFNNVLTAILGNISLARNYAADNVNVIKKLDEAEKASLQAKDLTQKLITFSQGGKPILRTSPVTSLLKESANLVIREKKFKRDTRIPKDLWEAGIDEGQMAQVFNNLLINAQQAMPNGGKIGIRGKNIHLTEKDGIPLTEGDYIRLSISDEGKGIPKKDLVNIFDPFFSTKPDGRGLGLTTCYSIVKNHGGHITVESKLNKGTTFYIFLPAVKSPPRKKTPSGSKRVLIMDDEQTIRDILVELLTNHGYSVDTAESGEQAIKLYKKAKKQGKGYHVVIMDLVIARGMGGKEAQEKLKRFDPSVKTIVSSGYSEESIMAEHKEHGFKAVVTKPYKIADLLKVIEDVIKRK